jgi:TolB-like protein
MGIDIFRLHTKKQRRRNQMKKIFFSLAVFMLIGGCSSSPAANPDEVSLNTAIRQAAARMESGLDAGTKIALINFTSPSQAFSDYVLDELSAVLVNNRHLVVVDRANLDRIRQELGFNVSGEVSDQSMQEIGQMLGAQALVTGSLTSIADLRRLLFKVIMTETAAVTVQHNAYIINDRRVQALIAQGGGSQGVAYGGQSNTRTSGNSNSGTTTRVPAQANPTPPTPTPTGPVGVIKDRYEIGDIGPAGGFIFYDKGNNSGGWRYLEAAPVNLGPAIFSNERMPSNEYAGRIADNNGRGVGKGKFNTEYIMDFARTVGGGFNWAARICVEYRLNGFNDWFIPSRDELNYMYGNLHMKGIGNFRPEQYWSSTISYNHGWGSHFSWNINFSNGENIPEVEWRPENRFLIRPCRQF